MEYIDDVGYLTFITCLYSKFPVTSLSLSFAGIDAHAGWRQSVGAQFERQKLPG